MEVHTKSINGVDLANPKPCSIHRAILLLIINPLLNLASSE